MAYSKGSAQLPIPVLCLFRLPRCLFFEISTMIHYPPGYEEQFRAHSRRAFLLGGFRSMLF